jgi:hypothetical protein
MKKNNKNNTMNINEILALIVTYVQLQIEYTECKMKSYKEWNEEECEETCCERATVSLSDEKEPTFDDEFREEWS